MATDVNESGQVVGVAGAPDGQHAFRWSHGVMQDLGLGWANAINNRGEVVGITSDPATADVHAWLWLDGKRTELGLGVPSDINNSGQIVGADQSGTPLVWTHGLAASLPVPGWANSADAVRINDRGQIIGTADGRYPILWDHGAVTRLGVLRSDDFAASAEGINNRGQIVGSNIFDTHEGLGDAAYLWRSDAVRDVSCIENANAHAINNRGQVLESHFVWHDSWGGQGDFVLCQTDGSSTALALDSATSINDRGQIAGTATFGTESHAALWTS